MLGSIVGVRTAAPQVVLTFDDGPDPKGTVQVLDALSEKAATATFFVLLTRVRLYPGLLSEIIAAGHEVALHGLDHRNLSALKYSDAKARVRDAKFELEDSAGCRIQWMRPPYGRQTFATWHATTSSGMEPVMWGRTTWDSRHIPQSARVAKATQGASSGQILLAHDGFAGAHDGVDDGPEPTVDRRELMGLVLDELDTAGLSCTSLGAALMGGTPIRAPWFTSRGK
jgi:peptidoglycan/xylan/chitin deacetylase (PgdA/CDA1 family)